MKMEDVRLNLSEATGADLETLQTQLGRPSRGVVAIAARCVCGAPAVVATAPRLEDGTPFPTTFYLTLPAAVKAASTLEAEKYMEELSNLLANDQELAQQYLQAHQLYLRQRDYVGQLGKCHPVPEIAGVSAGGMPTRIKCLHALIGHALASGAGVNPIGDIALHTCQVRGLWDWQRCACEEGSAL